MEWFIKKFRGGIQCLKEHGLGYTARLFVTKVKGKLRAVTIAILRKIGLFKHAKKIYRWFQMHIYENVTIRTIDPNLSCKRKYFFGKSLHKKPVFKDKKHNGPVVYLKINRLTEYALMCIQNWLTIIFYMDGDYFFVCDNKELEREIVRKCCFRDGDIKFLASRRKELKEVAENLWTGSWEMATYAHLTPFYHAKENGIKEFWAIDGDDTMFFLYPEQVVDVLNQVQSISRNDDISALSLDMHWSQMKGKHWSLGVLFINDNVDFCHIFEESKGFEWTEPYKEIDDVFNLDWFFNYIRDSRLAKVETFYVEDCYFCHWFPNILRYLIGGNLCFWHDGKVTYPILKDIYKNEELGVIDIADSYQIKLDVGLENSLKFMENEVSILYCFSPKARRVFGLGDFGSNSKYFLPF